MTTQPQNDYYQILSVADDATAQGRGSTAFTDWIPALRSGLGLPVNYWPDDFVKYLKYRK